MVAIRNMQNDEENTRRYKKQQIYSRVEVKMQRVDKIVINDVRTMLMLHGRLYPAIPASCMEASNKAELTVSTHIMALSETKHP